MRVDDSVAAKEPESRSARRHGGLFVLERELSQDGAIQRGATRPTSITRVSYSHPVTGCVRDFPKVRSRRRHCRQQRRRLAIQSELEAAVQLASTRLSSRYCAGCESIAPSFPARASE
jgi:hypothetical protein